MAASRRRARAPAHGGALDLELLPVGRRDRGDREGSSTSCGYSPSASARTAHQAPRPHRRESACQRVASVDSVSVRHEAPRVCTAVYVIERMRKRLRVGSTPLDAQRRCRRASRGAPALHTAAPFDLGRSGS